MRKLNHIARRMCIVTLLLVGIFPFVVNAQFSHPGIQHKLSDLERMKYGVEMGLEPWISSYANLAADAFSQYSYDVKGDATMTVVSRGSTNAGAYEKDMTAAYQNALMFWMTDDQRHADKAIEILNAWSNLTSVQGIPLNVGLYIAPMVNAAELIKHSDAGWAEADMQKFSDMLVYPGYSSTTIPQSDLDVDNHTFYWGVYNGEPSRAGNQELAALKGMMAIGIFLDNDTIYDRAFRYVSGQKHLSYDLPYESGPKVSTTVLTDNGYRISYDWTQQYTIEDYGYDGVLTNYIYDNGQSQESSRDQTHAMYGVSLLSQLAEVAWNQGDDLYSMADNRILTGLEYHLKYNLSYENTYPDQAEPWEPSIEAGEFYQIYSRTARLKSLKINPYLDSNFDRISRGVNITRPYWEMPLNHYKYRSNVNSEEYKWLQRARDLNIKKTGKYEVRSASYTDHPGWGALSFSRPEACAGDPIIDIVDDVPVYSIHQIGNIIEAENFDFFTADGEAFVYHDLDSGNSSAYYRLDESVDIDTCSEGGYVLSALKSGEWMTYTIAVPSTGLYNVSINYASVNANGKIKLSANGKDVSDELTVPFGGENSTAITDLKNYTIASDVILHKGVQALKISIAGSSDAFVLNSFEITVGNGFACDDGWGDVSVPSYIAEGLNYSYYEGEWDALPDFTQLTPIETGLNDSIQFLEGWSTDNFGVVYTGYIEIPIDGSYTFYTSSDEGSRLYIDGNLIVDNDGIHAETEVFGAACLDEGYHQIRVEYFEKIGDENFNVKYEGPGITKTKLKALFGLADCENAAVDLPEDAIAGIGYYYYQGDWDRLPNFDKEEVLRMGVTSSVNLNVASAAEYYGLVFSAYFNVAEKGDYTFYTISDDGSSLSIDGIRIVDNDKGTASGDMCLAAGWHKIEIEYFENTGDQSLLVQWEGKGFSRQNISGYYTDITVPIKQDQSITFSELIKYLGSDDFNPATASSGLPITYYCYDSDIASVVDGKIHLVAEGQTKIRASQAGNLYYNAASYVVQTITVKAKESQTITVSDITKYIGDEDFSPAVASSGLSITYESFNFGIATVVDEKLHIVGEGTTYMRASQAGNEMYEPAKSILFKLTVANGSAAIDEEEVGRVKLYPNPVGDMLNIEMNGSKSATLEIINSFGHLMYSKEIIQSANSIDLSHLQKGVYVIKITDDTHVATEIISKK